MILFGARMISSDMSDDPQSIAGFAGRMSVIYIVMFVINILYFSLMESSARQGTIGKNLMKIKVSDMDGHRIPFSKALIRTLSKILSGAVLLIGFLMAAFTARRQALHDMLVGTIVVDQKEVVKLNTTV